MRPHPSNNRAPCEHVMQAAAEHEPVFSVEQQYTLLDPSTSWPIGMPRFQCARYTDCSYRTGAHCLVHLQVGRSELASNAQVAVIVGWASALAWGATLQRATSEPVCMRASPSQVSQQILSCCKASGCILEKAEVLITLAPAGSSSEAVPGQWSFTLGPCSGLELGDRLWLARYILLRCTEQHNLKACLDPQPVPGDWNGSGAFVKYSTRETRVVCFFATNPRAMPGGIIGVFGRVLTVVMVQAGKGWSEIQRHLQLLEGAHLQHLMVYGNGNSQRLLRQQQYSSALQFTWGLEDRTASLRIPYSAFLQRKGWYEDRRPASNMDPYLVSLVPPTTMPGQPQ